MTWQVFINIYTEGNETRNIRSVDLSVIIRGSDYRKPCGETITRGFFIRNRPSWAFAAYLNQTICTTSQVPAAIASPSSAYP